MGKKCDKANANINILIDEICDRKQVALTAGGVCPYSNTPYRYANCKQSSCCDDCRTDYIEKLRKEMFKRYIVKD